MKIQSSELRIGNWILNAGGTPVKVTPERISDIDNKTVVSESIELTEEILLKAGFVYSEWDNNATLRYAMANGYAIVFDIEYKTIDVGDVMSLNIKYLHQLQNLYFALTNTELEINL